MKVISSLLVIFLALSTENLSAQDEPAHHVPNLAITLDSDLGGSIGFTGPEFAVGDRRLAISTMWTLFWPTINTDLDFYNGVVHLQFNVMADVPEISNDEFKLALGLGVTHDRSVTYFLDDFDSFGFNHFGLSGSVGWSQFVGSVFLSSNKSTISLGILL